MDMTAFRAAYTAAMGMPFFDTQFVDVVGPRLTGDNPTQRNLDEVTEHVIALEQGIPKLIGYLRQVDEAGSALNLAYDAELAAEAAASGERRPEAAAQYMYEQATARLVETRTAIEQTMEIEQRQLVLFAEARARIEHDLRWQEFVAERFGVDMSTEERGFKRAQPAEAA